MTEQQHHAMHIPTCPACGKPLTFGALVCESCGYNIRTGQKVASPNETVVMTRETRLDEELKIHVIDRIILAPSEGLTIILAILLNVVAILAGFALWILCDNRLARNRGRTVFTIGVISSLILGGLVGFAYWVRSRGYARLEKHIMVEKRLRSEPGRVQWKITFALASAGNLSPRLVFARLVKDDKREVQDFAVWALGELGDSGAAADLVDCLSAPREKLRTGAAESLEKLGASSVDALVEKGLASSDERVQSECRKILTKITGRTFETTKDWQRWHERYRRKRDREGS